MEVLLKIVRTLGILRLLDVVLNPVEFILVVVLQLCWVLTQAIKYYSRFRDGWYPDVESPASDYLSIVRSDFDIALDHMKRRSNK